MKKEEITIQKVKNNPAGGVLIGKNKEGQTIIPNDGSLGGFLVGKLHKEGGIKAINMGNGQPIEMQSNEIVITAPAVSDTTKREFQGKMMTNRQILSKINSDGGGVSFADGGEMPKSIKHTGASYKYGGKTMTDHEIMIKINGGAISEDFKYSKQFSGITIYTDVQQEYVGNNYSPFENKGSFKATITKGGLENIALESKYLENFNFKYGVDNWNTISKKLKDNKITKLELYQVGKYIKTFELKPIIKKNNIGGHLAEGFSLRDIADIHQVPLAELKKQVRLGMEAETEHTSSKREQMKIVKDHLFENPEYYTLLKKAGLKKGGEVENLVKDAKNGNSPSRDLNNYNDVLDLQADGMVGADTGLYVNGGMMANESINEPMNKEVNKKEKSFESEGSTEGKGKLYEFFTPQIVADKMLALAQHYGFKGGNVLEPATGSGRLIKNLKDTNITAFEISKENFEILKREFPNAELYNYNFEKAFLKEPRFNTLLNRKGTETWLKNAPFDLVLANPPYGKFSGLYSSYFNFKGQVEHFFILQTLYLLKKGGLGVYLIPSSFLRNGIAYNDIKKQIFEIAEFVDAYRLPSNIFEKTQIGTDILILRKK